MRLICAAFAVMVLLLIPPTAVFAQSSQSGPSALPPRLITVSGVFQPADRRPAASVEAVTLSIYAEQEGGTPLWQETQSVALDAAGRYTVLLGATHADGIPAAVFASGEAQWLGTLFSRLGEVEGPRVRITSVPYALRASDAQTLGGLPASAYLRATAAGQRESRGTSAATSNDPSRVIAQTVLPGTTNFLAKYVNPSDVGNSGIYEAGGLVAVGNTIPRDYMSVQFANTNGSLTGYAVQNLGNTANSYSGMLFYDQNGLLGQFQGFNNFTHEYRINNVARVTPGGAFNGSINFQIGGTSRFLVGPTGNIGIGTTTPTANLEVSNALSPAGATTTMLTTYHNGSGSAIIGRTARGTAAAPTALLANDTLLELNTGGYGATGFGALGKALIAMGTSENWTDTAQGTQISFFTTANGSTTPGTRMRIAPSGNVGIGTFSPVSNLEVSNALSASAFTQVTATTFANAGNALFVGSRARGTSGAPAAVQNGDQLAFFGGRGYGTSAFGATSGISIRAAETWTNDAQGSRLVFLTTPVGQSAPANQMSIEQSGNVVIGRGNGAAALEVVRTGDNSEIFVTAYDSEPEVVTRLARGTPSAPSAVQTGDLLGTFGATGYGATGFSDVRAGMAMFAAEDWTIDAEGTALVLGTTPIGGDEAVAYIALHSSGNVGIGTPAGPDNLPTALDRLQVYGDIRIGTAGTNGCVMDFSGNGLVGTCVSDRRFKKDITPFGQVLGQLTALQPVHYFWRAAEFPERHFGDSRASGLIAQEVEQVLPELVVTGGDGFKAVDYGKLPLLTIQAVKELHAENEELKQRVAELERLVTKMLGTAPH